MSAASHVVSAVVPSPSRSAMSIAGRTKPGGVALPSRVVQEMERRSLSGAHRAGLIGRGALNGQQLSKARSNGFRWTAAQWIENSASTDVDVPLEEAWALWDDREQIPTWMPWISSVKVEEDDPKRSRWTLQTNQFGQDWTLSWLAMNMAPIPQQKIHWRSVEGSNSAGIEVSNRGSIRFFRRTPTSCNVTLTISYEVPDVLAPFGNALQPLVESIIGADMERFAKYAKEVSPSK